MRVDKSMADAIISNAKRLGLAVCVDTPTPGDGNCFYHSVIQQLAQPDIIPVMRHTSSLSHSILRGMVYVYIQENYNDIEYIQQYCTIYELTLNEEHDHLSWDAFLYDQSRNGTYSTELFIKTTAVIIGVDIHITSEHYTRQYPFNKITAFWNGSECSTSPPLLIGNISGVHFQSLLPIIQPQQLIANNELDTEMDNVKLGLV